MISHNRAHIQLIEQQGLAAGGRDGSTGDKPAKTNPSRPATLTASGSASPTLTGDPCLPTLLTRLLWLSWSAHRNRSWLAISVRLLCPVAVHALGLYTLFKTDKLLSFLLLVCFLSLRSMDDSLEISHYVLVNVCLLCVLIEVHSYFHNYQGRLCVPGPSHQQSIVPHQPRTKISLFFRKNALSTIRTLSFFVLLLYKTTLEGIDSHSLYTTPPSFQMNANASTSASTLDAFFGPAFADLGPGAWNRLHEHYPVDHASPISNDKLIPVHVFVDACFAGRHEDSKRVNNNMKPFVTRDGRVATGHDAVFQRPLNTVPPKSYGVPPSLAQFRFGPQAQAAASRWKGRPIHAPTHRRRSLHVQPVR